MGAASLRRRYWRYFINCLKRLRDWRYRMAAWVHLYYGGTKGKRP
jgi:hypothetical protein